MSRLIELRAMYNLLRCFSVVALCWGGTLISRGAEDPIDFSRDISPLLSKKCFQCHGPDEGHRKGDLRLDLPDAEDGPFQEHDGYQAIKPGHVEESEVWQRIITDDEDDLMPPPESNLEALTEEEKAKIKQWIEEGAEYKTFWAFLRPTIDGLPDAPAADWGESMIDRLIGRRLEQEGLSPNPRATKRALIRRLYFDLTGLPPTPDEIDGFLNDPSETAYEDLVDRLLNSPHYGEHMAKYWLDLVRFADTNGLHHDHYREMTPYRDWVIRAFNQNLGYDAFVTYQLAGDLYPSPSLDQQIASGFNRLHLIIDVGTALPEESFTRNVIDRVTAFGTAFMGMTLQCASCHDHKYDPVTTKDFYQLYAFFNNFDGKPETGGRGGLDFKRGLQSPYIEMPSPQQTALIKGFQDEIDALQTRIKEAEAKAKEAPESADQGEQDQLKEWKEALKSLQQERDAIKQTVPAALVMKEREEVRPTYILKRGAYDQPGDQVERGVPSFLPPMQSEASVKSRMDLAQWLMDPDHPLTARVAVNRFWQQLFGVGLVKTSEDFGAQGEHPSHPELLDFLAVQFVDSGWDIKQLMRMMVLSQTYQQSSVSHAEQRRVDPENRLLSRGPRFRMDSEMIRDQILKVSGLLNLEMGGKSVKPPQPPKLWEIVAMPFSYPRVYQADQGGKAYRRSVYTFWKRALPPPQMSIFDAPTREACIARRERTNTPLQALLLMNEPEYFKAAAHCAARLLSQPDWNDQQRLNHLFEIMTSQQPNEVEMGALEQALENFQAHYAQDPEAAIAVVQEPFPGFDTAEKQVQLAAWTMVSHSLLNLDIVKTRQ